MSSSFFKKISKKYNNPLKVQALIRGFNYNKELSGETLRSAKSAYLKKTAHCLEGAILAAAILENCGYPPLVMSLESQDDLDHVIFVYKTKNKWGSVACSRDQGLFGRKPIFRSLRDLAMSYYEPYIDKSGCITGYQVANLDQVGCDWRFSKRNVWKVEQHLIDIKHVKFRFNKKRYLKFFKRYAKGLPAPKQKSWL